MLISKKGFAKGEMGNAEASLLGNPCKKAPVYNIHKSLSNIQTQIPSLINFEYIQSVNLDSPIFQIYASSWPHLDIS